MAYTTPKTWVAGEIVEAAELNQDIRDNQLAAFPLGVDGWTSYVPTLTASGSNPTLGIGSTAAGKYIRVGRLIIGNARLAFGAGGGAAAGSGFYRVSLPVAPVAAVATPNVTIAQGWIYDASANALLVVTGYQGTSWIEMIAESVSTVSEASPWTWAASDQISLQFMYEAAS